MELLQRKYYQRKQELKELRKTKKDFIIAQRIKTRDESRCEGIYSRDNRYEIKSRKLLNKCVDLAFAVALKLRAKKFLYSVK